MKVEELVRGAADRYGLREELDFGQRSSRLRHPGTGKQVALLRWGWDMGRQEEVGFCDLRCGAGGRSGLQLPSYVGSPFWMHGPDWVGIRITGETDPEVVWALFSRAVRYEEADAVTLELGGAVKKGADLYRETPIQTSEVPPDILQRFQGMFALQKGKSLSLPERTRTFYEQGKYMEDYEDSYPWEGEYRSFYPAYQDLKIPQLRGYFSWRTKVRRGEYEPISSSCAQIYLYELINGIGVSSSLEALQRIHDFERGFLDSGAGDANLRDLVHRYERDLAVVGQIPPKEALPYLDAELMKRDQALAVLRDSELYGEEELFSSICYYAGERLLKSPVLKKEPERGRHLFCGAWRYIREHYDSPTGFFALCFGKTYESIWSPFPRALFYQDRLPAEIHYEMNPCRSFQGSRGTWKQISYENIFFDKRLFAGFFQQADASFRLYLKTGAKLREQEKNAWAIPYLEAFLQEEERAYQEARRPKITIDLSGLEKIRRDALVTQNSLLTEEERLEAEELAAAAAEEARKAEAEPPLDMPGPEEPAGTGSISLEGNGGEEEDMPSSSLPLDAVQREVLLALLAGRGAGEVLRAHHLMSSLAADAINEALFDFFGDTVLSSEDDQLALIEDYEEELRQLLEGVNE